MEPPGCVTVVLPCCGQQLHLRRRVKRRYVKRGLFEYKMLSPRPEEE